MRRRVLPPGLGDLPADLQTHHGRHLEPVRHNGLPAPGRMSQSGQAPGGATAGGPLSLFPFSFVAIAGSKQYLNTNDRRRYLGVQNNTGADLWMNLNAEAAVGTSIKITDGWFAEWFVWVPSNALFFYSAAGGGAFTVLEG